MSCHNLVTRSLGAHLKEIFLCARLGHHLGQAAAGLGALSPLMALANPTGGQVVGGTATIATLNPNSTRINQTSQNAVINWQSFSVGANQYVQFLQPDSSATILNRVIGGNPTSILGQIMANGQVFLVNPNGILFGKGSVLDVSGLVASTQDIADADFMAGKYNFVKGSGAPDASVINQGTINVSAGGYVVLAGDYVENDGTINAETGQVLLVAGGGTTLTFDNNQLISYAINGATLANLAGVNNTGEITAQGGAVVMTADVANALTATAVNNAGFVAARSIQGHEGLIVLSATGGETENSGTLDASANQVDVTGGTIVVRSNEYTEIAPTSVIDDAGDSADGGFLHISGHEVGIHGQLNIGKGGDILLDPNKLTLEASGGNSTSCNGCEGGVIHANYLQHQLNNGINMTLIASGSIVASTNFHTLTATTPVTTPGNLALKIGTVTINSLGGTLHRITGDVYSNHGALDEVFTHGAGGTINLTNTGGVTIDIKGAFSASAFRGTVTLDTVTAQSIFIEGNHINTTGNLTATGATSRGNAVNLFASAGTSAIGMNVGNITANGGGRVLVHTAGHGAGLLKVGNVTNTLGSVSISANGNGGSALAGGLIDAGSITAKEVVVRAIEPSGIITLGAIDATSAYAASMAVVGGLGVYINAPNTNISMGGTKITASHGGVVITGGNVALGSVSAGGKLSVTAHMPGATAASISVTPGKLLKAQSVNLNASASDGGDITTSAIIATGGSIFLGVHAINASHAASINAGSLAATVGGVTANQSGPHGHITVGNITAPSGAVRIVTTDTGSGGDVSIGSATGKTILVQTTAPRAADIRVNGPLKAFSAFSTGTSNGFGIILTANATGGANSSGGNIRAVNSGSQAIHALGGGVRLHAHGGLDSGGIIQVHGGIVATGLVDILGSNVGTCCGSVSLKNVVGDNGVRLRASGKGNQLSVGNVHAPSGSITVLGSHITLGSASAGGKLSITAVGSVDGVGKINVAASHTLIGRRVFLGASGGYGGSINVGNVTAFNGSLTITAHDTAFGSQTAKIVAKNLEAGYGVIDLQATGNGAEISVGTITGEFVSASAHGAGAKFIAQGITATGASSSCACEGGPKGYIKVQEKQPSFNSGGSINIGGLVKSSFGYVNLTASNGAAVKVTGAVLAARKVAISGGDITVGGSINAGGSVTIGQKGTGGVSIGGVSAGGKVAIAASNSHGNNKGVTINGSVKAGGSVNLSAFASGGGTGANIKVSGSITARTGEVLMSAEASGKGGNLSVSGNIKASNSAVNLLTIDRGGTGGGNIHVGNVTAAKAAGIFASYLGTIDGGASHITAKTGIVTGEYINAKVTGIGPIFSAAGMTAKGAASGGTATSLHDYIHVNVFDKGTAETSGQVKITGPVLSSHGAVSFGAYGGAVSHSHASHNSITAAAITAGNGILIEGNNVKTGALTATGGGIIVNQEGTHGGISITGLTSAAAGGVSIGAIGSGGITVKTVKVQTFLSITANGVHAGPITVNGLLSASHGNVTVKDFGSGGNNIHVTGLVFTSSGNVDISAGAGNHSGGNVTVGGKIGAPGGKVTIETTGGGASGGNITVGSISAHRAVSIGASYKGSAAFKVKTGQISAGSFIRVKLKGKAPVFSAAGLKASANSCECGAGVVDVALTATGSNHSSGSIKVTGAITTHNGGLTLNPGASTDGGSGLRRGVVDVTGAITTNTTGNNGGVNIKGNQITLGSVTANGDSVNVIGVTAPGKATQITVNGSVKAKGHVDFSASNTDHAASITITGNIATAGGSVHLFAHGSGAAGGNITVGNVSAGTVSAQGLSIAAQRVGTAPGFLVKTGNLTGAYINVNMNGKAPHFSGGALTGKGSPCECSADVNVVLTTGTATTSSASMNIKGAIKADRDGVYLNADRGVINMNGNSISAAGTDGEVHLVAGRMQLGNISAGYGLLLDAYAVGSHAGSISAPATSLFTAKNVTLFLGDSAGTKGANIAVGKVSTTGMGAGTSSGDLKISDLGLGSQKVTVTTGDLTATKAISVAISNASGGMSLGRLTAPKVKVTLMAGNLKVGQPTAASGATVSAAGGSLTVASTGNLSFGTKIALKTSKTLHFAAGSNLTLNNANISAAGVSGSAAKNLTVMFTGSLDVAGAKLVAGKVLKLDATGAVQLGNAKLAGSAVDISGTRITNSSAHGSIAAAGGTFKAAGGINLNGETLHLSGAGPTLSAGGGITLAGAVASGSGGLTLHAGSGVEATGLRFAAGSLHATAGGSLDLTSANVKATKVIDLNANQSIKLAKARLSGSAVSAAAGGISNGGSAGSINATALTLDAKGGDVALTGETLKVGTGTAKVSAAGNVMLTGAVLDAGSVGMVAAGGIDLTGADVKATKVIDLHATQSIKLAKTGLSGSAVSATAGGGISNGGPGSAATIAAGAGGLTLKAGGNLVLGGETLTVSGGGAALSGASLDLTKTNLTASKTVDLTASKHILLGKTDITAGGSVTATANGSISNGGSAGSINATALTLDAKGGNVLLTGETLKVGTGTAKVSAAGNVTFTGAVLDAGSVGMVAAGSIDLKGITLAASKGMQLAADKDIILSGVHITTGTFGAAASGTIHNGGGPGSISAQGMTLVAKKDINLSSTTITLGKQAAPGFNGDTELLAELSGFGIGPTSSTLNGAFLAGGSLSLDNLVVTGHYLLLQGTSVSILGKVTVPANGFLVQLLPADPTASIGIEGTPATTQAFNVSNQGFFALFPGDTIAIGDDTESGAVFIGSAGPFSLAPNTNLFLDTTGSVTGLNLITSTGIVSSLEIFVAATGSLVFTAGEIDPTADSTGLGDQTDKKHLGSVGVGGTGPQSGNISSNDDTSGVCH